CGLQEIISYPLTTVEREALLFPVISQADLDEGSYVTIANPISPERKVMRHTLLSSVLDTLREALRHRERVLLFEIGRYYLPQAAAAPARTDGRQNAASIQPASARPPVARMAVQNAVSIQPAGGRRAVQDQGPAAPQMLGVFGEVHPEVREHFELPHDPVCLAE